MTSPPPPATPPSAEESRSGPRRAIPEGACLFAAIGVALYLRTVGLSHISLWTDEFITLITVRRPLGQSLLQLEDYAGPLHQLLLRLFVHRPDPPAWLLRAPAIAFGVLGVPAAWWLARMVAGRWVAILVAALVAINPELILHAREARQNTLFVLLATLAVGFFLQAVRTGSRGRAAVCVVATTLLLYTHYFGFLVLGAMAAYLVLRCITQRRLAPAERLAWAALLAATGLGLPALWLMSRYMGANAPATVGWIHDPGLAGHFAIFATLLGLPPEFLGVPWLPAAVGGLAMAVALWRGFSPSPPSGGGRRWRPGAPGPPGEGVGGSCANELAKEGVGNPAAQNPPQSAANEQHSTETGGLDRSRAKENIVLTSRQFPPPSPGRPGAPGGHPLPEGEGAALCALWLVFAFFPFVAAYYLYRPLLVERYALPAIIPALILLLAAAASAGRRLLGPRAAPIAALLAALILAALALSQFHRETTYRSDMRSLVAWVHAQARPADAFLVADWNYSRDYINPERVALAYYHLDDRPVATLQMQYPDQIRVLNPQAIAAGRRSFIVAWVSLQPPIRAYLIATGRRFTEHEFGGLHVFEVERDR